VTPESIEE